MFDSRWVEISAKDYVIDDFGECLLKIFPVDLPFNIFGTPLFADYYTIHDPIGGTVGFAPNSESNKTSLPSKPIPSKKAFIEFGGADKDEILFTAKIISWAIVIIAGGCIVYVLFFFKKYSEDMKKEYGETTYIYSSYSLAAVSLLILFIFIQPFVCQKVYDYLIEGTSLDSFV